MSPELTSLVERGGGLVTRAVAAQVVPTWTIESACRRRAALAWLDGRGALSHTTALAVWRLPEPAPDESVHVTVPNAVGLRPRPGVEVHRRSSFMPEPTHTRVRDGQLVTPIDLLAQPS